MTNPQRWQRWFEYEKEAHSKALATIEATPVQRAIDLLAHLIAARMMWLYRLGGIPAPPTALEDENVPLVTIAPRLREMEEAWDRWLAKLDDAELDGVIEYHPFMSTDTYRSRVEDVLAQLFGHSSYHRGQIATFIRQAGGTPASTDFIFWSREKL